MGDLSVSSRIPTLIMNDWVVHTNRLFPNAAPAAGLLKNIEKEMI